jgi:hypothetical protein
MPVRGPFNGHEVGGSGRDRFHLRLRSPCLADGGCGFTGGIDNPGRPHLPQLQPNGQPAAHTCQ